MKLAIRKPSLPRKRVFSLALLVTLFTALSGIGAAQEQPPKNYALLIGINKYPALEDLKHAENDASKLAEILSGKGYEVAALTKTVRRRDIVSELSYLARTVNPQDTLLIYFAGHGVKVAVGNGSHTYWMTHDATLELIEAEAIRLTHLLDYVNDIQAQRKMIILDHCHSGDVEMRAAVAGGARDAVGRRTVVRGVFPAREFEKDVKDVGSEGLIVLAAATDRAYEFQDLGHGLMTYVLIEALTTTIADENNDGKLSVLELKKRQAVVREMALSRNVTQTSIWIENGTNLDWILADIQFMPKELNDLVGHLIIHGGLPPELGFMCQDAIDSLANGTLLPDSRDQKIINLLIGIRDTGTSRSWSDKAEIVQIALSIIHGDNQ